jgi:hypothetical protein
MTAADVLRALILVDILAMALFAIFYLRRRALSWTAFLGWGLLAVLIPLLGPFLVIAARPGGPQHRTLGARPGWPPPARRTSPVEGIKTAGRGGERRIRLPWARFSRLR